MAKKYKCPYCQDRHIRKDLIDHIDKEHEELIPDGSESAQVVYDVVNNTKGAGRCRVCGSPTKWNSSSKRYDVLCENPRCKQKMREDYQKNMIRVHGTYNILNDDEQQKKMLANRSISGAYKFSDGGFATYTGSYEKKFLEFADKVMQIPSKDIMAPGPTLEYEMNGEKHFYITDFLYIPYNLIIEVKDGGSNPNSKDSPGMRSSRQRTIEKEKLITDKGEFNYLRLTDNQFVQLLEIFMEIKKALLEGDNSKIVRINEQTLLEENNNIIPDFRSDTELFNFMKKNISYKNYTKLMSPEEVYSSKKGSCHDQVMFELYCLRKLKLNPKALFLIEYNSNGTGNSNVTHSLVYYENNGKICWFENAWGGNEGIHKFNSISELKNKLHELHKTGKFGNIKEYPELEITSFKSHEPGESLQQLVDICVNESYISESKSTIDNNYKPKGKKNLSSFKRIHITESVINKYKKEYPFLSHVRCKDTEDYICDGYMWFNNDELVATVGSCEYTDDKTKWIVSLEITKKYRGYGLSKQILDYAVKTMNCKYLSVNKNNKIAKKVYDNYGFKAYQESDAMYYMTIDKNIKESTRIFPSGWFDEYKDYGEQKLKELQDEENKSYLSENNQSLINFAAYHLEPTIKPRKQIYGGWDEELYSKSIEAAIINDIKHNYRLKGQDKVSAYVYTAGEDLKAVYLGTITIFDKNNPNDWEWEEQEPLDKKTYDYLMNNPIAESTDISNFYEEDYE